jgi:hypothetical protein
MLRIPHCLDNRLTDGGKVVSPTRRPLLYSPEKLFLCFRYSFLREKIVATENWLAQKCCGSGTGTVQGHRERGTSAVGTRYQMTAEDITEL